MDTIDLRQDNKDPRPQTEAKVLKSKKEKTHEISWPALSFYHNPKKNYIVLAVIALIAGSAGMLFLADDPLAAIFLVLSSFVLILYSNRKPVTRTITIDSQGILIGESGFPYKDLKSFWIDYRPGEDKELSLESKKWYIPYIKIVLGNQNPIKVRAKLIDFLPEKEHERSLADILSKKIGL